MSAVTVLSGPERRRRRTAQQKAQLVEESYATSAIVAEVTRRPNHRSGLLGPRAARLRSARAQQLSRWVGFPSIRPASARHFDVAMA